MVSIVRTHHRRPTAMQLKQQQDKRAQRERGFQNRSEREMAHAANALDRNVEADTHDTVECVRRKGALPHGATPTDYSPE